MVIDGAPQPLGFEWSVEQGSPAVSAHGFRLCSCRRRGVAALDGRRCYLLRHALLLPFGKLRGRWSQLGHVGRRDYDIRTRKQRGNQHGHHADSAMRLVSCTAVRAHDGRLICPAGNANQSRSRWPRPFVTNTARALAAAYSARTQLHHEWPLARVCRPLRPWPTAVELSRLGEQRNPSHRSLLRLSDVPRALVQWHVDRSRHKCVPTRFYGGFRLR